MQVHLINLPLLLRRRWKGDYLGDSAENPDFSSYRNALTKAGVIGPKNVLFSCMTYKFNR